MADNMIVLNLSDETLARLLVLKVRTDIDASIQWMVETAVDEYVLNAWKALPKKQQEL